MIQGNNARSRPLTGGYYWFPIPGEDTLSWSPITCHDLGSGPDVGHVDLWPLIISRLAVAWGKDAKPLMRRLANHYTGLPRGRVTRPKGTYLVFHGSDSPVADWLEQILARFRLAGVPFKEVHEEHERMLPGDPEAIERALGIRQEQPSLIP